MPICKHIKIIIWTNNIFWKCYIDYFNKLKTQAFQTTYQILCRILVRTESFEHSTFMALSTHYISESIRAYAERKKVCWESFSWKIYTLALQQNSTFPFKIPEQQSPTMSFKILYSPSISGTLKNRTLYQLFLIWWEICMIFRCG